MEDNNGEPAFPTPGKRREPGFGMVELVTPGMSLRDYFAAKAMNALLAPGPAAATFQYTGDTSLAKMAYGIADAMLLEREKKGGK